MFSNVNGADIHGIRARIIQIEADIVDGLPIFSMVGYLSSAVKEAKERVRSALQNTGVRFPAKRITINLSPADLRKEGTSFDLAIAVSLLAAFGHIPKENLDSYLFAGELGLDGKIHPVRGILPIVLEAKKCGFTSCVIPKANQKEGSAVEGIKVYGVKNVLEVMAFLRGEKGLNPGKFEWRQEKKKDNLCFSEVRGQGGVKRALEIAVSGMHNILILGPPGTGKTMLARRIPTIMPPLSRSESEEITKIYSICGLVKEKESLMVERPFRSPHHTTPAVAMVGGGRTPIPGEVTLANGGVLFLDEFLEFNKSVIELLRQPMEERKITVSRLNATYEYPCNTMFVAAANACKCGYYPDKERCQCTLNEVRRYIQKAGRPVLDRMDICAETHLPEHYHHKGREETSEEIRRRVEDAVRIQKERYRRERIKTNAELTPRLMQKYCNLGREENKLMELVYQNQKITTRGMHRILKVARTIADLDESEEIKTGHLAEAVRYRGMEKYFEQE